MDDERAPAERLATWARTLTRDVLAVVGLWASGAVVMHLIDVPRAPGLLLLTAGWAWGKVPAVARAVAGAATVGGACWWLQAPPEARAALVASVRSLPSVAAPPTEQHEALPELEIEALAAGGGR